ncbi:MAG: translation initiation factor IF-3 [Atopobiaceae bacterium]|nr:translation initiation factor IF-3 [Atopobiaceae bacterium]
MHPHLRGARAAAGLGKYQWGVCCTLVCLLGYSYGARSFWIRRLRLHECDALRRSERKVYTIARNEGSRINEEITSRTCRLIAADGTQLGLFGVRDALRIAREQNMDLVEIAPNAEPPVCKVMDYSKYKYEQDRKAKAARKKQVRVEVKEMKFRPKIDVGDYETKKNHVMRFLRKGARVKITIMFRGREMAHPEQGLNVLDRLADDLRPYATVEQQPKMEGRNMHMLVAPIRGAFDNEEPEAEAASRRRRKGR